MCEIVKADYHGIGSAAVYRMIQLLTELHLVDRIDLDGGFVWYEIGNVGLGTAKHHPHHPICINSGKQPSSIWWIMKCNSAGAV